MLAIKIEKAAAETVPWAVLSKECKSKPSLSNRFNNWNQRIVRRIKTVIVYQNLKFSDFSFSSLKAVMIVFYFKKKFEKS
jgi:hypothetical protein